MNRRMTKEQAVPEQEAPDAGTPAANATPPDGVAGREEAGSARPAAQAGRAAGATDRATAVAGDEVDAAGDVAEHDEVDESDEDEAEDDELVGDVAMSAEDEDLDEAPEEGEEAPGAMTIHLPTDLRRRLRRRAEREGVQPEELAEELLVAAIRRPAGESLADLRARLDKV